MNKLNKGQRNLTDDEVVEAFIQISGFYAGDETRAQAEKILLVFLAKLEEELYASSPGL